eukprot:CAMPEP_0194033900 /NCGR_PEP_ID=MMETSP0009_2-20130614/6389_1 /TAXON_ID=210454 /ORGANISM="Grammatophora oceanica, Strain CCMP 410" /LENGTH=249 /DNA_ID=CAMNT_0038674631 /DNA_START=72 /DNA_END=821 /DNA_ORIENTATION=-
MYAAQFEDAPEGPETRLIDSIMRRQASAALLQQSLALTQRLTAQQTAHQIMHGELPVLPQPEGQAMDPKKANVVMNPGIQPRADEPTVTVASLEAAEQLQQSGVVSRSLPNDVGENDVLCGRGKGSNNFSGNKRFQELVRQHRPIYVAAKKRRNKRAVCEQIIGLVLSRGGRFLGKVQDGNSPLQYKWEPLSYDKILVKVSQALRETPKLSAKKMREMKMAEMSSIHVLADMASLAMPVAGSKQANANV